VRTVFVFKPQWGAGFVLVSLCPKRWHERLRSESWRGFGRASPQNSDQIREANTLSYV